MSCNVISFINDCILFHLTCFTYFYAGKTKTKFYNIYQMNVYFYNTCHTQVYFGVNTFCFYPKNFVYFTRNFNENSTMFSLGRFEGTPKSEMMFNYRRAIKTLNHT